MSWVTIDYDKCNSCGICVLRCATCFSKVDDEIKVHADAETCILCGHCISLCAADALTHEKVNMSNFGQIVEPVNFRTDEFIDFLKERRSHRHFKKKEIPREDLERLIDATRYAPTGSNVQTIELIVVQNPERIQKFSDLTVDFFEQMGDKASAKLEKLKLEKEKRPESILQMEKMIQYRDRLMKARNVGFDAIFYKAPAVIIFHSPLETSTPKDNCVIASTTMGLIARTMGLETTYIGLFEAASKSFPPLIEELGLPEGHQVLSVLIIGYPKLKFLRTVDRTQIETQWE